MVEAEEAAEAAEAAAVEAAEAEALDCIRILDSIPETDVKSPSSPD